MRVAGAAILGFIPFLFGALVSAGAMPAISNPFTGVLILQAWGTALLGFCGGSLWGAAMAAGRTGILPLILSFVPVAWALSASFWPNAMIGLITGFLVFQVIAYLFFRWQIIRVDWLAAGVVLTTAALLALCVGAMA